jgi:hypothetical protein
MKIGYYVWNVILITFSLSKSRKMQNLIYSKESDSGYFSGTCTSMFIAMLFTIAKLWKQPRCPTTDEWIKKMWYLYTMEVTQP